MRLPRRPDATNFVGASAFFGWQTSILERHPSFGPASGCYRSMISFVKQET